VVECAVELEAAHDGHGRAHLVRELLPQGVTLGYERSVQLLQAALAQRAVGRPVGVIKGAARGRDRHGQVFVARIRDLAENRLCGRVDVDKAPPRPGVDELAVDEHPNLANHVCSVCPDRLAATTTLARVRWMGG
jgi:hypothetical protein